MYSILKKISEALVRDRGANTTFPRSTPRSKEWSRILSQRRCKFVIEEPSNQNNGYHNEPVIPQRLHQIDARFRHLCIQHCHVEMASRPHGLTVKYKERD